MRGSVLTKCFAVTVLALAAVAPSSLAAQSYRLSYTFDGNVADQVITIGQNPNSDGFYTVTDLSGNFGGVPVTLLPLGTVGSNDNLFKPTPYFFDFFGIGFGAGGLNYSLYTVEDNTQFLCTGDPFCMGGRVSGFTVTPEAAGVPEPAVWALMILGFGAVGCAVRPRHKVRTIVSFA